MMAAVLTAADTKTLLATLIFLLSSLKLKLLRRSGSALSRKLRLLQTGTTSRWRQITMNTDLQKPRGWPNTELTTPDETQSIK
jgi:hypothetical protein